MLGIWKIQKEIALQFKEFDISGKWSQRIILFDIHFMTLQSFKRYQGTSYKRNIVSDQAYRELGNHH